MMKLDDEKMNLRMKGSVKEMGLMARALEEFPLEFTGDVSEGIDLEMLANDMMIMPKGIVTVALPADYVGQYAFRKAYANSTRFWMEYAGSTVVDNVYVGLKR